MVSRSGFPPRGHHGEAYLDQGESRGTNGRVKQSGQGESWGVEMVDR